MYSIALILSKRLKKSFEVVSRCLYLDDEKV